MKKILLIQLQNKIVEPLEDLGIGNIAILISQQGYDAKVIYIDDVDKVDYNLIRDYNPDFVGITLYGINVVLGIESINSKDLYEICKKIKKINPGSVICLGGKFAADYADEILAECCQVDFILHGTAENSILQLLENQKSLESINQITYRKKNQIVRNMSHDENAVPNRDFDFDGVQFNKGKIAMISTSISCNGECAFCNYPKFYGKWKPLDIEKVISRIDNYYHSNGIRFFEFVDRSLDNMRLDYDRIRYISDKIIEKDINISYMACIKSGYYAGCDDETLGSLKKSGLVGTIVGIESGNDFDLKLYNKGITLDNIRNTLEKCRKYNIIPNLGFINFNPLSTRKRLKENIDLLRDFDLAWNLVKVASRLYPLKNTVLFQQFSDMGLLYKENMNFKLTKFLFNDEAIEALYNHVYRVYLENKNILHYVRYYFETYPMILLDFERYLTQHDISGLPYASAALDLFYEERYKLSEIVYHWFTKLLDNIYEQNRDYRFDEITKVSCLSKEFKNSVNKLLKENDKLLELIEAGNINYDLLDGTIYQ